MTFHSHDEKSGVEAPLPVIPDHDLVRCIGSGSYGKVWLARSVMGTYRAVKIIHRKSFTMQRPFDREFFGIQKFEPVSRTHPGLVTVLHIGKNEPAGYFFYIMEAADDVESGQKINPETYVARTLGTDLQKMARIPWEDCLQISLSLAAALDHLHKHGLVHRDIKPSNIIFVNGQAKFADIGLVADIGESATFVGSEGYIPPEGPGKPTADLFGLGKVLYEISMGKNQLQFPELPTELEQSQDMAQRKKLFEVVLKACELNPRKRFQTGQEMHDHLLRLLAPEKRAGRLAAAPITAGADSSLPPETLELESVGGAVPLGSKFYLVRPADEEFRSAIVRCDSIVLVKGARQMGKTSLLARGLQEARDEGLKVILTDFQKFNSSNFESLEKFYLTLGNSVADQLDLDVLPEDKWDPRRSPNTNFERYVQREALQKMSSHLVWGMDEVDRLFACSFGSEVFGLFRSWHNNRALDPSGPWNNLTLAIAYATEAHLFITDMNQSPFNVGTRLALSDFLPEQVAELNRRYGSPLKDKESLDRFTKLLGGQPFLVRGGLHELATKKISIAEFEAKADSHEGVYGDHLRRILNSLTKDPAMTDVVRGVLRGQPCPSNECFYRLRAAGLISGNSATDARFRCQLYAVYLAQHLL